MSQFEFICKVPPLKGSPKSDVSIVALHIVVPTPVKFSFPVPKSQLSLITQASEWSISQFSFSPGQVQVSVIVVLTV